MVGVFCLFLRSGLVPLIVYAHIRNLAFGWVLLAGGRTLMS